ncbi:alpha/beta hydrolase [Paractinoplanes maris]|uniref:alpha/beta hydrolase n=1 Tax=Paractinoplanes maris TaxID=1734446 RepID=UPI00202203B3|nr:alpha/beta hydrolase [Actinoplanes maris]
MRDRPVRMAGIDEQWITIDGGPAGPVRVSIVRPEGATGTLPVVLHTHGAPAVSGDEHTHDRLMRDLATGTGAAVVCPRDPVADEQSYAAARWVTTQGGEHGLDGSRMAVAGDSVGGRTAIALTLLARERGDVTFRGQVLFCPVTGTDKHLRFAEGYWLRRDALMWFWDQHTTGAAERKPAPWATTEDLTGLPPALVVTGECDGQRDEGESYATRLRAAGVRVTAVRYGGITHDFVTAGSRPDTPQARAAVAQAVAHLSSVLASPLPR